MVIKAATRSPAPILELGKGWGCGLPEAKPAPIPEPRKERETVMDRLLTPEEMEIAIEEHDMQHSSNPHEIQEAEYKSVAKVQDAKTRRKTAQEIFADLARYELSVNGITRLEIIGSHWQALKAKWEWRQRHIETLKREKQEIRINALREVGEWMLSLCPHEDKLRGGCYICCGILAEGLMRGEMPEKAETEYTFVQPLSVSGQNDDDTTNMPIL